MIKSNFLKTSIIAASLIVVMGCQSTDAPQVSPDGLELKHQSRSTIAYTKAGVSLADYDKVGIMPSQVAFKKNWKRDYNRDQTTASTRINDDEVLNIKTEVAKLFDEVFKEEFSKSTSFTVVEKVASGTLILKPAIVNLDVNAPDIQTATNVKNFVSDAGEATLFLEIYDGVSGEILARIVDDERIGDHGYVKWATRVSNKADAKRTIRKWAKILRKKFDAAKAK